MSTIAKINALDPDDLTKVNDVARAAIADINTIDWPEIPVVVPEGLILGYYSTTPPSGWTYFSSANGYYIYGTTGADAGTTYAGGGTVAKSTGASIANHTGTNSTFWSTGGDYVGTGASGAHAHTISGIAYTPPYQNMVLIKAQAGNSQFPAYGVHFSHGGDRSSGQCANVYGGSLYLRASTGTGTGGSNSISGLSGDTQGSHRHGNSAGVIDCDVNKWGESAYRGGHDHSGAVDITMTPNFYRYSLSAWRRTASDYDMAAGMIGLYESDTPPDNWYLCDGTNGTPNLNNRYIRLVPSGSEGAGGDGTVTAAATITHSTHLHRTSTDTGVTSGKTCSSSGHSGYHADSVAMASHEMSSNYSWRPASYSLNFIMWSGVSS